jgi:hypothetical protein
MWKNRGQTTVFIVGYLPPGAVAVGIVQTVAD